MLLSPSFKNSSQTALGNEHLALFSISVPQEAFRCQPTFSSGQAFGLEWPIGVQRTLGNRGCLRGRGVHVPQRDRKMNPETCCWIIRQVTFLNLPELLTDATTWKGNVSHQGIKKLHPDVSRL